MTFILFLTTSICIVAAWHFTVREVAVSPVAILLLVCTAYMSPTLLTSKADLPGRLAYVAYPWQATGKSPVKANTGIVFTQLGPWTKAARESLLSGELPFFNRGSASGAPLMANQQTAIFHPFTLLGLLLPLGKAFTLSAALRLFVVAFFTYLLLRSFDLSDGPSLVGALAYTFCTFHVVWLLFPLGLTSMMLPLCLVGVQELRNSLPKGFFILVAALSLTALGGHPESALWVWLLTTAFATFIAVVRFGVRRDAFVFLGTAAAAFVVAGLLTAWWWAPTLEALQLSGRFQAAQSLEANPADHGLSSEWLYPLVAPNVLGNPADGTYKPPRGFHPAVLNDYGEVASSYAGLLTLALALVAPFVSPKRAAVAFAFGLLLFSAATFGELPIWRDFLRSIPLVGISIHQRLRLFWNLGLCIAAALALEEVIRRNPKARRLMLVSGIVVAAIFLAVYAAHSQALPARTLGRWQFMVPLITLIAGLLAVRAPRWGIMVITGVVLIDLLAATYRYNRAARPSDLYPPSGAITTMQQGTRPYRIAALGWSFIPDTPGAYGLEDLKTTDPVQHSRYMRLLRGYLRIAPESYDQVIGDVSHPFFDFLNVRYVYAPPGHEPSDATLVKIYDGADGRVFQNVAALPRYFVVERAAVEPDFDRALARSRLINDFMHEAVVDSIPESVPSERRSENWRGRTGLVLVTKYDRNGADLRVESDGWNLLVSSEVHWPGWRARVNGSDAQIVTVNGAFVGLFVPPGTSHVRLYYRPRSFDAGLGGAAVGLGSLIAVLVAAAGGTLRSRCRSSEDAGARTRPPGRGSESDARAFSCPAVARARQIDVQR